MTTKHTINSIKQLIDLNGTYTNFELEFEIDCPSKKPFYAIVADQATLDSNQPLEYQHVTNGQLSGTIRSDKNVYQNYFLVLKADEPCEVEIKKSIKEIEPQEPSQEQLDQEYEKILEEQGESKKGKWRNIVAIVCGLLILVVIGLWVFTSSSNSESVPSLAEVSMVPDYDPVSILNDIEL